MRGWFLPVLALCACSEYVLEGKEEPLPEPDIEVAPRSLDFGLVPLGETGELHFTISNVGDQPLDVGAVAVDGGASFTVVTAASNTQLAPGETADATVTYAPAGAPEFGQVLIPSNDPDSPVVTVDLTGSLGVPGLLVEPLAIDFGLVELGTDVSATVDVTNTGTWTTEVVSAVTSDPVFTVAGFTPLTLGPGERGSLDVHFLPTDPVVYGGVLTLGTSDLGDATVTLQGTGITFPDAVCDVTPPFAALTVDEVTWLGSGSSDPGGRPLSYDWQLVSAPAASSAVLPAGAAGDPDWGGFFPDVAGIYTAELTVTNDAGLSDTCETEVDARDAMPTAVCSVSPDPAEALYDLVTWSGAGSSDPAGGSLTYAWTLLASPPGSAATIPAGVPANPDRTMLPDVAGIYTAELVVTNTLGLESEPCVVDLEAIPAADLWIEMFWGTANDDMDLHVTRSGGALRSGDDCYYGNCTGGLAWPPAGASGDPLLDLDDIPGTGPENVNLLTPDNVVYSVWVHDHTSRNHQPANDVTVNIYLGGALAWTDTLSISGENQEVWFADIDWATQTVTP